jgi:hypothetical protein
LENQEVGEQLDNFEQVLSQRLEEDKERAFQGQDTANSSKMLLYAENTISQLQALVKRLIPEDDRHTIITQK